MNEETAIVLRDEATLVLASPFFVVVAGHATVWTSFPFTQQRIYAVCMRYSSKGAKSLSVRFDVYIHSWYTGDLPRRIPPLPSATVPFCLYRAFPRLPARHLPSKGTDGQEVHPAG
jgi:hypothetical protein